MDHKVALAAAAVLGILREDDPRGLVALLRAVHGDLKDILDSAEVHGVLHGVARDLGDDELLGPAAEGGEDGPEEKEDHGKSRHEAHGHQCRPAAGAALLPPSPRLVVLLVPLPVMGGRRRRVGRFLQKPGRLVRLIGGGPQVLQGEIHADTGILPEVLQVRDHGVR